MPLRRLRSLAAVAVAASALTLAPGSVPPVEAALADPPGVGDFGIEVSSVTTVTIDNGATATLVTGLDAPAPYTLGQPVVCGEFGCTSYGISWDTSGLVVMSGCTGTDKTCVVRHTPNSIGDGYWAPATAQLFLGRFSQGPGQGYAIHARPIGRVVTVRPEKENGDPASLPADAFAVRTGHDPLAEDCATAYGWIADLPSIPPCIRLPITNNTTEFVWRAGLPRGSGSWSIIPAPLDTTKGLRSQAGYRYEPLTVAVGTTDIDAVAVERTLPTLRIVASPSRPQVAVGDTVEVTLTVEYLSGYGPVKSLAPSGAALATIFGDKARIVGGPTPPIPSGGFSLSEGGSAEFTVQLEGLDEGTDFGTATLRGVNFLQQTSAASAFFNVDVLPESSSSTTSTTMPPASSAPAPPVITTVTREPGSGRVPGVVRGTVSGRPGATLKVDIATHDRCVRLMSGTGVRIVGTVSVKLGADGTGRFAVEGAVAAGDHVYGTAVTGGKRSAVSDCTKVPTFTVPSPPRAVEASGGTRRLTVSWRQPSTNGGKTIVGYRAVAAPGGRSCTSDGTSRRCTITGLKGDTRYSVRVTARNAVGASEPSAVTSARTR